MASSLSQSAVTIVLLSLSLQSLVSPSAAAPPRRVLVRQSSTSDIPSVLGKTFELAGKVQSASCADSIRLEKTSPFKGSAIEKTINELPGASAIFSTVDKILSIIRYPDISVAGTDCAGDGEVVLATPGDVKAIVGLGSVLGDAAGGEIANVIDSAESVVEITENAGVAVGFDQNPGKCGGSTLPVGYAWVKNFGSTLPDIAKAAGVENSEKDDLFLVTISTIPDDPSTITSGNVPLCVFSAEGNTSSNTSTPSSTTGADGEDEDDDEESNTCFPADALVSLESGETKRMDQLQIGDSVMVGVGEYSNVFMFTHKVAAGVNTFVTLKTASGASLSLTAGHYIYADDALVPARDVRVGSSVVLASGSVDRVVAVGRTSGTGLYNPQTVKGDVVVNGILASTYTTAVEPRFAHAVLAPFRWMNLLGLQCTAFESGGGLLGDVAPRGHTVL